jgi:CheY-like chemotaxis protein
VARLREGRPALPAVLMSGYAQGGDEAGCGDCPSAVFLQKPFAAESLLSAVRAALDAATPRAGAG